MRLGAVDEHDPALDALRVVALGFQHRLGDHLGRIVFEARPDPFGHRARTHRRGLGPILGLGRRLSGHQALQEILRAAHQRRDRVDGGHRRHAFGVLLLARPQAVERGELLALPPAPLGRLARRPRAGPRDAAPRPCRRGEHHNRLVSDRLARRRSARRVEGVEVLSRASDQLFPPDAWAPGPRYGETARTALRRTTAMRPLRPPGGAPRASNAQPPGSATHRADADCRDRAARSPGARPPPSRRSSPTAGRAAAAPNARRRRPPRPDPPPPPGCVGPRCPCRSLRINS